MSSTPALPESAKRSSRLQFDVTEDVDAVIDRHDHHVAVTCETGAIEAGSRAGAVHPRAAMQPDHDRSLRVLRGGRSKHVQEQAVFADRLDLRVGRRSDKTHLEFVERNCQRALHPT
jgi:hypothetical protein